MTASNNAKGPAVRQHLPGQVQSTSTQKVNKMNDMTNITDDMIRATIDAASMMRIAAQILSQGEVDDQLASELSWMLSSVKERLEPVIDLLQEMEGGPVA